MPVLIAWIVAVVLAGVILGVLGYGLVGNLRRLNGAVDGLRTDILPRVARLQADLTTATASGGRHSYEQKKPR